MVCSLQLLPGLADRRKGLLFILHSQNVEQLSGNARQGVPGLAENVPVSPAPHRRFLELGDARLQRKDCHEFCVVDVANDTPHILASGDPVKRAANG